MNQLSAFAANTPEVSYIFLPQYQRHSFLNAVTGLRGHNSFYLIDIALHYDLTKSSVNLSSSM